MCNQKLLKGKLPDSKSPSSHLYQTMNHFSICSTNSKYLYSIYTKHEALRKQGLKKFQNIQQGNIKAPIHEDHRLH